MKLVTKQKQASLLFSTLHQDPYIVPFAVLALDVLIE